MLITLLLGRHYEVGQQDVTWMMIKPLVQCISPRSADMREDFPEPTAPTTATNRPGLISKDRLTNTRRVNIKIQQQQVQ